MANVDTIDITKLILVEQGSTPSNPASGKDKLFVRSSDHLLCLVNSSGTVTPYGGALTNPMTTTGDIIVGGASGTPARLAIGAATDALMGGTTPAYGPGAATSYSPALTAAVTNPTLGSGSAVEGHYIQIGKLVTCWGSVSFGSSGVAAGSGEYHISLPVTAVSTSPRIMGNGLAYDSSANRFYDATAYFASTTVFRLAIGYSAGAILIDNATPVVWAASDAFVFQLSYEAA